jgi:predicted metal-binding membrane protein
VITRLPPPLLAASSAGWVLLAAREASPDLAPLCVVASSAGEALNARFTAALALTSPTMLLSTWSTMLLAMMPPLLAGPLLHVWRRSLPQRRLTAITLFLLGYAVPWAICGAAVSIWLLLLKGVFAATETAALVLAASIALMWQLTPSKQMSLNSCHRQPPLAAFDARADADALFYGARHGFWCAGACWALMALPMAAGNIIHWPAMIGVTLALILERARPPHRVHWGAALPPLPHFGG